MKEVKFRYWDNDKFIYWSSNDGDTGFWDIAGIFCTFEQFTGLKDKNGVEIYEGDIIESEKGNSHIIKYDIGETRYMAVFNNEENINNNGCHISKNWILNYSKIVIGDIHKNPELLNAKS